MQKYIVKRHFINGSETTEEYGRGVERLRASVELSSTKGYGFKFGLKLTVDEKSLDREAVEEVLRMSNLPGLWFLYDPENRGAGTSYRQVLFNPTFYDRPSIVANVDLDQYVTDTEESLERILELFEKMEKEDALYANGSRSMPVRLAQNERNSSLRIIHELFHSSIVGSDKLRVEERLPNVTPAYAEIGESTSGFYVVNFSHRNHPELTRSLAVATRTANMKGFATDYYVALRSPQLGNIAKGYVIANPNKFYIQRDEKEEFESVKRLISGQTRELGKTDIRDMLIEGLRDMKQAERIAQFYPIEDVEFVRELMLESLGHQANF